MRPDHLEQLTARLLESYDAQPTRPDQGEPLPSMEAIIAVMEEVRRLLFPGFYADEHLNTSSRVYRIGHWIARLHQSLTRVLSLALAHERSRARRASAFSEEPDQARPSSSREEPAQKRSISKRQELITSLLNASDLCAEAEVLSARLLEHLPHLRAQLITDAQAALAGDPAASNIEEVILTYPGFEAIMIHRFAHVLYSEGVPYLPRALSEYAHARTGIDIHPGAQIGASFFIDHGTGVVIGETTEIGHRVKIYQGVTLGALSVRRSLSGRKRHPTIEDDVIIYAGATVLGGDTTIGSGSVIGGNLWIVNSIPPQSTVIGTPPSFEMREQPRKMMREAKLDPRTESVGS